MRKLLKTESREVKALNIKEAKNFAILFDSTNKEQLAQAQHLLKDLGKQYPKMKIHCMGWFKKEAPEINHPNITFFSKPDIGFFYQPKDTEVIRKFQQVDYDIVMDISMEFNYPIKRLMLSLNSLLRVGIFSRDNESMYDLFINTTKNVSEFSKHAIYYLGILNKN